VVSHAFSGDIDVGRRDSDEEGGTAGTKLSPDDLRQQYPRTVERAWTANPLFGVALAGALIL